MGIVAAGPLAAKAGKKISATILDFAKPLTDLVPEGAPMATRREALQIAITVWNCLILEEMGNPEHLAELRNLLEKGPPETRALMTGAVDVLRRRKELRCPEVRLLVGR